MQDTIQKKKRGRPKGSLARVKRDVETETGTIIKYPRARAYHPKFCQTILEVAQQGGHVAAMCLAIGIKSRTTFYEWIRDYPDFNQAYEQAKLISLSLLEHTLTKIATGEIKGNFSAVAMLLNNKYAQDYHRTGNETQINIGSINTIETLDSSALDAKIQQLQRKLNLLPQGEEKNGIIINTTAESCSSEEYTIEGDSSSERFNIIDAESEDAVDESSST